MTKLIEAIKHQGDAGSWTTIDVSVKFNVGYSYYSNVSSTHISCGVKQIRSLSGLYQYLKESKKTVVEAVADIMEEVDEYSRKHRFGHCAFKGIPFVLLSDTRKDSTEIFDEQCISAKEYGKNPNSSSMIKVWIVDLTEEWEKRKKAKK